MESELAFIVNRARASLDPVVVHRLYLGSLRQSEQARKITETYPLPLMPVDHEFFKNKILSCLMDASAYLSTYAVLSGIDPIAYQLHGQVFLFDFTEDDQVFIKLKWT